MTQKEKQYAAYMRVSTIAQEKRETIDIQKYNIEKFVGNRDDIKINEWYSDDGISAFKERPQFNEMMGNLANYDGIIITRLDRIGRSLRQLLKILNRIEELEKDFIVIEEAIDTTTSIGKLMFHIRGAFAEYEASVIRERMAEGREIARMKGVKFGRREIIIPEKELKEMKKMYEAGIGFGSISRIYSRKYSTSTIRKRLIKAGVTPRKPKNSGGISPRTEEKIYVLYSKNISPSEIANILDVKESTVTAIILEKLGATL